MIGLDRLRGMSRGQLARFAFGLLVASALAIGGVVAGLHTRSKPADRTQPVGAAVAPLQASGAFLCPGGHPLPAYPSGFSYPPGHPSAPSNTVRPSACYATAADATAAGYPPRSTAPPRTDRPRHLPGTRRQASRAAMPGGG